MSRRSRQKKTSYTTPANADQPQAYIKAVRQKLAHVFHDVDMRMGHTSLRALLKRHKITIHPEDFIVFINTTRTMVKAFAGSLDAIIHIKQGTGKVGKRIDLGMLKYLPQYCNGPALNVDSAVEKNIKDLMERRKKRGEVARHG